MVTRAYTEEEIALFEAGEAPLPPPDRPIKEPEPPPPPPPEPEPVEPEPPTVPDRPGAQIATVDGEKLYIKDSTMYKGGFRTEKEYRQAQGLQATYGIHTGVNIPEGTIITTTKAGKPLARYTQKQLAKIDIADKIEAEQYRIPVIGYEKEILLTPKQVKKIEATKTDRQKFALYKEYGIVGKKAKYYTPEELKAAKAEVVATQFEMQQFKKRHTKLPDDQWVSNIELSRLQTKDPTLYRILREKGFDAADKYIATQTKLYEANLAATRKLRPYTEPVQVTVEGRRRGGGVDGAQYLRDNPKDPKTLRNAGFSDKQIIEWRNYNKQPFVTATELEKYHQAVIKAGGKPLPLNYNYYYLATEGTISSTISPYGVDTLGSKLLTKWQKFAQAHPELAERNRAVLSLDADRRVTKPSISLMEFTSGYLDARGIIPATPIIGKVTPVEVRAREQAAFEYGKLYGTSKLVKEVGLTYADYLVPGVYVARNWTTLSTKDKVVNIAIDVASVLLAVGLFKVAGAAARQLARANRTIRTVRNAAKAAGKAGKELDDATKAYQRVQRVTKKFDAPLRVKHAKTVQRLQQVSMKADRKFLTTLEKLTEIDPKELRLLEKQTGLRGLTKAINDITKAQKAVDKAWKAVEAQRVYTIAQTPREILANQRHLYLLGQLQKAQARLQIALGRAGSTLKPRYTPPPPAETFRGFGIAWQAGKPKPKVKAAPPTTLNAIESFLARAREVTPTGREPWLVRPVAVKVAEKVAPKPKALHKLKLKAIYEKPKTKPVPKPKVPKVKTSAFPGIALKPKEAVKVAAITIPLEAIGRMTAAQIAKYYGTEELADVVSKSLDEHLTKFRPDIARLPRADVVALTNAAVRALIKAKQKGLTDARIAERVREAVRTVAQTKPALRPVTKVVTRVTTKTIIRHIPKIRPPIRPPIKPPIRPPLPIPPAKMTDKQKRRRIKESKGAFTFRMGQLATKDVWYTYIHPYTKPQDKIIVVGPAPRGATVVRGPGSAIKTAQMLYGKRIARRVTDDIGFMDVIIEPIPDRKGIRLSFRPDPKGETVGDFGTPTTPPITPKIERITSRSAISRGKPVRITPKVGKLR